MEVMEGADQAVDVIEGENKSLTFDLAMPDKIAKTFCRECFSRWRLSRYSFCASSAFILCGQLLESVHCFPATCMYCPVAEFALKFVCDRYGELCMFVRVSLRTCQLVVFFQCFVDRAVLNAVVQF